MVLRSPSWHLKQFLSLFSSFALACPVMAMHQQYEQNKTKPNEPLSAKWTGKCVVAALHRELEQSNQPTLSQGEHMPSCTHY